MLFDDKVKTKD